MSEALNSGDASQPSPAELRSVMWPQEPDDGSGARPSSESPQDHVKRLVASGGVTNDVFQADEQRAAYKAKREEDERQQREHRENGAAEIAAALNTLPEIVALARTPDGAAFDMERDKTLELLKDRGTPITKKAINADVKAIREHLGLFQKNARTRGGIGAEATDGSAEYPKGHERPCYRMYLEPQRRGPAGLYFHTHDDKGNPLNYWLCSPLRVIAETRSRNDSDYGLLVEFKNDSGWKKWCLPAELLASKEATEAKRELMRNGLKIEPDNEKFLIKYLRSFASEEKLFSTSSTGWDELTSFVLPERVIGSGEIYFQSRSIVAPYGCAGTFEGWKRMAALAKGNTMLMFSLCASFAGPLLKPLHITGGGIHLYGDSSKGKSTNQRAAVSTWGAPKFKVSWNNTANSLEGLAVTRTDTLLALDEINEARDPKVVGEAAYALTNGSGRGRLQSNSELREIRSWRVMTISSGERTIESVLAKEHIDLMAGQQVRFLDIRSTSGKHGAFDELHGRESGAVLSDEIARLSAENYGWAGAAFVEALIARGVSGLSERHANMVKEYKAADGQEGRAARVFAMCGIAGELAIEFGVVPWTKGEAEKAARDVYVGWKLATRPESMKSLEDSQILRRLVEMIERYEDARFSDIRHGDSITEEVKDKDGNVLRDVAGKPVLKSISHRVTGERYGYWDVYRDDIDCEVVGGKFDVDAQRRYYLTTHGWKAITRGFDHSRVVEALEKVDGALFGRGKDQVAKGKHVPGKGTVRLYWLDLVPIRAALDS